jgi:hypothetical protein
MNLFSKKCMSVINQSNGDGQLLITDNCDGNAVDSRVVPDENSWVVPVAQGRIMSGASSMTCLDVYGGSDKNLTSIVAWPCHKLPTDAANQQWTFGVDQTIRSMGKCMDVQSPAAVVLNDCHGGDSQRWIMERSGRKLRNVWTRKCLSLTSSTQVSLVNCAESISQTWSIPLSEAGIALNPDQTKCLDMGDDRSQPTMQVYDCLDSTAYNSSNQTVSIQTDGTVRFEGKCLAASQIDLYYNNTGVQWEACATNEQRQQWTISVNKDGLPVLYQPVNLEYGTFDDILNYTKMYLQSTSSSNSIFSSR